MTRISCEDAQALMRDALGDGDGAESAPLSAHVSECRACADAWDAQRAVRALLSSLEPEPVPAGFLARLDAAIDDMEPWWRRFDWRWWTLRAAPIAVALLLLVGGMALRGSASASTASPVSAALYDDASTVSSDSLLLAVLSGSPDDTVSRYEGSAR